MMISNTSTTGKMSDRAEEVKLSGGERLLLTVVWSEEFAMTCVFGCVSRFRANNHLISINISAEHLAMTKLPYIQQKSPFISFQVSNLDMDYLLPLPQHP